MHQIATLPAWPKVQLLMQLLARERGRYQRFNMYCVLTSDSAMTNARTWSVSSVWYVLTEAFEDCDPVTHHATHEKKSLHSMQCFILSEVHCVRHAQANMVTTLCVLLAALGAHEALHLHDHLNGFSPIAFALSHHSKEAVRVIFSYIRQAISPQAFDTARTFSTCNVIQ